MEFLTGLGLSMGVLFGIVAVVFVPLVFRKVVPTNMVHITQSKGKTTSYGAGQSAGNVYYNWPSWVPVIGITRTMFKVSNFALPLLEYKAYDKERVPFELDITAFFRVADTNMAAQRVSSFEELEQQLKASVQGAVRKILASHDINQIMVDRATFGEAFTAEVKEDLKSWGVEPVKSMELMDIRDTDGSKVIANIMAKKSSEIEKDSRVAVAHNRQAAETAEINAQQTVDIRAQEAQQAVGQRTAEKNKAVGIAEQKARQDVATEEAVTMTRTMEVRKVEQVRLAEITREAAIVAAEQGKQTAVITADGALQSTKLHAEGVRAEGEAVGAAETAKLMAPVAAQIALAKEIATNAGYQNYLVSLRTVEAGQVVGTAQAEALKAAEIKVIANAGDVSTGVTKAMELFSPRGGLALGGMFESLSNTPQGNALMNALREKMGVHSAPSIDIEVGNGVTHKSNGSAGDASVAQ